MNRVLKHSVGRARDLVEIQWVSRSDFRGGGQESGPYVGPFKTFDNISDNDIDVLPRIIHGCFVIPIAWVRGWGRVMHSQSHVMFNVCPIRVM